MDFGEKIAAGIQAESQTSYVNRLQKGIIAVPLAGVASAVAAGGIVNILGGSAAGIVSGSGGSTATGGITAAAASTAAKAAGLAGWQKLLIAGGAGALAASLFNAGGKQDLSQQQTAAQTVTPKVTVTPTVSPDITTTPDQDTTAKQTQTTPIISYGQTAGRDLWYSLTQQPAQIVSPVQSTPTFIVVPTSTSTTAAGSQDQGQTATQQQSNTSLITMLIIGGVAIAVAYMFTKNKKR